jgi:hypothetical protein
MSEADVIATVQFLAEQYNTKPPAGQLDFWIEALSEYAPAVLRRAAVQHIKSSKWMPKLSEIIELCNRDQEQAVDADANRRSRRWVDIDWKAALILQTKENEEARQSLLAQGIPEALWNVLPCET